MKFLQASFKAKQKPQTTTNLKHDKEEKNNNPKLLLIYTNIWKYLIHKLLHLSLSPRKWSLYWEFSVNYGMLVQWMGEGEIAAFLWGENILVPVFQEQMLLRPKISVEFTD